MLNSSSDLVQASLFLGTKCYAGCGITAGLRQLTLQSTLYSVPTAERSLAAASGSWLAADRCCHVVCCAAGVTAVSFAHLLFRLTHSALRS